MGRIAREYLETSFFHVMVQGINKEYIFKNEMYIKRYIKLMHEKLSGYNLKILAFCIMNNHAHILINAENKTELSIYMQKLNSTYAKYYNYMSGERVGYVFRDRFKSEPITSKRYLIQCVKYIHQNPLKAQMVSKCDEYEYSSSKDFKHSTYAQEVFSKKEIIYICDESTYTSANFMDIDLDINEKIIYEISNFLYDYKLNLIEIFTNKNQLRKLIKYLKDNKKIKYCDIMKYFGISKGVMERLKR